MSDEIELNATVRTDLGKGASRRLRRLNDGIPAIVYGGGEDPMAITIAHKDISHAIENEGFFSQIISIKVGKKSQQVIIKALQRHPSRPFVLHADFLRIRADEAITVNVPVHFLNEDNCKGVKLGGGSIIKALTEIEITCLPADLPQFLEVDMEDIDIHESVHLSDVVYPEGVTSIALGQGGDDADQSVATVVPPRAEEEEEVVDEELEGVEGEEGEVEEGEAPPAGEGDGEEKPEEGGD